MSSDSTLDAFGVRAALDTVRVSENVMREIVRNAFSLTISLDCVLLMGAERRSGDDRAVARAAPGLVVPLWNEAAGCAACCTISQKRGKDSGSRQGG